MFYISFFKAIQAGQVFPLSLRDYVLSNEYVWLAIKILAFIGLIAVLCFSIALVFVAVHHLLNGSHSRTALNRQTKDNND